MEIETPHPEYPGQWPEYPGRVLHRRSRSRNKKARGAMEREEATAGEAKPAAGARRTRLVKVDQENIDFMLKQGPASRRPLPVLSDKVADMPGKPGLRAIYARAAALVQRLIDRDEDILHQYRTKGYAEVEEGVSDDDNREEEEAAPPVRRRPSTGRRRRPATTRENQAGYTG